MTRPARAFAVTASLALGATLLTVVAGPPGATAAPQSGTPWTVVAQGLDNPRQLNLHDGTLMVAEAGTGGPGPCFEGPEGQACFGKTGAITKITRHGQHRIARGLPSLAGADGSQAIGPADVLLKNRRWFATIGLGTDPAVRGTLPSALLGTVVTGRLGHSHVRVLADLAAREAAHDPDHAGPDSNPTGMSFAPSARRHARHHQRTPRFVVTDSGANALVTVAPSGRVRTLAVFDSPGTAPLPFPPFDEVPMQAVPTSVVRGPDGAWYVSELTGFPFAPGASRIHRVTASGHSSVWATGLTNVTDLAWRHGRLYAVQLSDAGLANETDLPMGSLVRVVPGGPPVTVVGSLPAPYGVTTTRHAAYVTTCSVCADHGEVVRIPLP
ncbi:ScyD/ScyE family protein [Nocardioides daejeonensis]|uniref:ScyD/ScyE family protein n=1 Tax=Nocardioides daejeonensis TaxID=1046556 RepID=UPI0013A57449|nr:ScyD/ScyE family protein [Nocardioides daejeonensis]